MGIRLALPHDEFMTAVDNDFRSTDEIFVTVIRLS